ncbi:MAG: hypothetical protein WCR21_12210 [Bacteroidota bacterium]
MKKTIVLGAMVVFAMGSCKKDRTCTCTSGNDSQKTTYLKVTKAQANANCTSYTYKSGNYSMDVTCALD